MSSTTPSFTKQQELANKRPSDLEDHEKIYLLKREIDNLRSQIRQSGAVQEGYNNGLPSKPSEQSTSSNGFCTSGFCRAPMLTIFLALAVAMVARWRRRQAAFAMRSRLAPEMTLQFELQDAHEYVDYQAPSTSGGTTHQFL